MEKVKTIINFDEELNKLCGLGKAKEILQNYFEYIQLRQAGQIKDLGNYNILIKVPDNYSGTNQIVELIQKVLKDIGVIENDYYEVKQREITTKLSKIDNDLILLGDKVNYIMMSTLELLPQYIKQNDNKIFILVYNPIIPKRLPKLSPIEEVTDGLFAWKLEITGQYTEEEKENYICKKLQNNNIKVKSSTFVSKLAKEDISKIDKELMYITVKSKANKKNTVTDEFLKQIHRQQYIANKNVNGKTALQQLDDLIGLDDIKKQIYQISNYVTTAKCRHQDIMLHMALMGNSGCGKNEIAKVIGKIYKEQGILSKGDFIEVSRSDLVAGYVGQSALKTKAILEKAKGSVLYVDEVYSLDGSASEKDYSHEVIAEIIKFMEDERQDICIIFGGYIEETTRLLESNRGFNSRVPFKLYFNDYTSEELYRIFKKMAKANNYKLSNNIKTILIDHFEKARLKKDFGNRKICKKYFRQSCNGTSSKSSNRYKSRYKPYNKTRH